MALRPVNLSLPSGAKTTAACATHAKPGGFENALDTQNVAATPEPTPSPSPSPATAGGSPYPANVSLAQLRQMSQVGNVSSSAAVAQTSATDPAAKSSDAATAETNQVHFAEQFGESISSSAGSQSTVSLDSEQDGGWT